jgi:hypothetical protein
MAHVGKQATDVFPLETGIIHQQNSGHVRDPCALGELNIGLSLAPYVDFIGNASWYY